MKPKESKKKRKVVIESDSDEEPFPSKLRKDTKRNGGDKKNTPPSSSKHQKKENKVDQNESRTPTKRPTLKPTTPADFFSFESSSSSSSSSTKRKKESPQKRKPDHQVISLVDDESPLADEDEVLKNPPSKKQKTSVKESPAKVEIDDDVVCPTPPVRTGGKHGSLAGKLSSKLKEEEETRRPSAENKMKESVQKYLKESKEIHNEKDSKNVETTQPGKQKDVKNNIPFNQSIQSNQFSDEATPSNQIDESLNESNTDHTPVQKKKNNFWAYKNRDGPTALGSKELPVGAENCLQGLAFVITGILDSFEREVVVDCIQRYGGKVTGNVSGKTSFVIVGREPGQSKMEKAGKHKTKQLSEDDFLELLKSRPARSNSPQISNPIPKSKKSVVKHAKETTKKLAVNLCETFDSRTISQSSQSSQSQSEKISSQKTFSSPASQLKQSPTVSSQAGDSPSLLWVDKYKPKTMKNIVGQQGEKSNANKLKKWLLNWQKNNSADQPKPNFYAGKEDGSIFKAALLSGPPGVGKTTTATIVCQDVGFSFIEMNASDTRGKRALETVIKESLSNVTVNGMLQGNRGNQHALIMDEVDGMAGTEDRGGMQELIQLIKKSKIPIICMCNDRNHPKVRSLANHCFDLRFYKPRVEQVKGFALSIAAREGLKIPPQAMEQVVVGANQDIRQVVHNLQMWTSTKNTLSYDEAKANAAKASKNIKMGPFDVVKQLFTHSEASKLNIHEKSDLFFMDYSFIPLFIQENYISVNPNESRGNMRTTLELLSATADSIADANLVERLIRGEQNWSLLPLQGFMSTVVPSINMSGYLGQRIGFPQWLGKNSSRNKHDRILQDLKMHMSLSSNCLKSDLNMDCMFILRNRLKQPLVNPNLEANAAAKQVISFLDVYNLTREDWDSIMEIGKWGDEPDFSSKISTKVKSAFTRLYNKESHKTPYVMHKAAKKSRTTMPASEEMSQIDEDELDEEDDDIVNDAMIKVKKESASGSSTAKSKKSIASKATKTKENTRKKKK